MERTWVWKGQGYGREMIMEGDTGNEGTMVWRGPGYGRDKGMEGI